MNKAIIIGIIFLLSLVAVNAATVSHSAGQITPGGFQVGNYNFPGILTVGTDKFFVNASSGNVGIGTKRPLSKVQVDLATGVTGTVDEYADLVSASRFTLGVASALNDKVGLGAAFASAGETIPAGFVLGREGTSWGTFVAIHTHPNDAVDIDAYPERVRIDSNGNVGIGTTTPTINAAYDKVLQVHGVGGLGAGVHMTDATSGATATDGTLLFQYGVDNYLINYETGKLRFYTGGAERITVASDGNIGIGKTDPGQKLDVVGNIAVSGTVDGRDVSADGAKLDGIESGATADQTDEEILEPVCQYLAITNPDQKGAPNTASAWVKLKETVLTDLGGFTTLKIVHEQRSSHNGHYIKTKVYRNGFAVGTEWMTTLTSWTTCTDIIGGWANGDLLQIYGLTPNTTGLSVYTRNLKAIGHTYTYTNQDP